jgi:hypothetical protein
LIERTALKTGRNRIIADASAIEVAEDLSDLILKSDLFYSNINRDSYIRFLRLLMLRYFYKLNPIQKEMFLKVFLQKMSSLKISQNFSKFIEDEIKSPSFSLYAYLNLYSYTIYILNPTPNRTLPLGHIDPNLYLNWATR